VNLRGSKRRESSGQERWNASATVSLKVLDEDIQLIAKDRKSGGEGVDGSSDAEIYVVWKKSKLK
jgi:hypothetical protein